MKSPPLSHAARPSTPCWKSRWRRAAAILTDPGQLLYWNGADWHCVSSDGQTEYLVTFHGCDCPDAHRTKDLVEGIAFCKHRLALLGLPRHLRRSHAEPPARHLPRQQRLSPPAP